MFGNNWFFNNTVTSISLTWIYGDPYVVASVLAPGTELSGRQVSCFTGAYIKRGDGTESNDEISVIGKCCEEYKARNVKPAIISQTSINLLNPWSVTRTRWESLHGKAPRSQMFPICCARLGVFPRQHWDTLANVQSLFLHRGSDLICSLSLCKVQLFQENRKSPLTSLKSEQIPYKQTSFFSFWG